MGVLRAQTTTEGLTLEVASIRPSAPNSQGLRFDKTPDMDFARQELP